MDKSKQGPIQGLCHNLTTQYLLHYFAEKHFWDEYSKVYDKFMEKMLEKG